MKIYQLSLSRASLSSGITNPKPPHIFYINVDIFTYSHYYGLTIKSVRETSSATTQQPAGRQGANAWTMGVNREL